MEKGSRELAELATAELLGIRDSSAPVNPGDARRLEAIKAGNAGITCNARIPMELMVLLEGSDPHDAAGGKAINTSVSSIHGPACLACDS